MKIFSLFLLSTLSIIGVLSSDNNEEYKSRQQTLRSEHIPSNVFTGYNLTCDTCKGVELACNKPGYGNFNNGTLSVFSDPMGYGNFIVTELNIVLKGIFSCEKSIFIKIELNGIQIMRQTTTDAVESQCLCQQNSCLSLKTFKLTVQSGLSAYKYNGQQNILTITSNKFICLQGSNISANFYGVDYIPFPLPLSSPVTGGTSIRMINNQNTGDDYAKIVFKCAWFDSSSGQILVFANTSFDGGFHFCTTPEVPNPITLTFGVYLPVNGFLSSSSMAFQFYPVPTNLMVVVAPCNSSVVYIKGNNFTDLSPPNTCSWSSTGQKELKLDAQYLNSTTVTCSLPSWPVNNSTTIRFSGNNEEYGAPFPFACTNDIPLKPTAGGIPGVVAILLVFGGFTLVAVVILIISQRVKSKWKEDEERQGLLRRDASFGTMDSPSMFKQIDFNGIKCLQKIGKGTFGEVYRGIWNGTEVGVKFLNSTMMNEEFMGDFNNEVTIMRGLRHPNILQFLGACTEVPNVCIVMEYMSLGSLYKILHDENPNQLCVEGQGGKKRFDQEVLKRMMLDAARGMNYLHKSVPVIIHRDLKTHNLLVDENWKVKVCDFGLSKILEVQAEFQLMTACGTPSWSAPEILRNEHYTEKVDIYSFGIVLWECVTMEDPYLGMAPYQVVLAVGTKGMRPTIPSDCPPHWASLMRDCWQEIPESRPSFDEVIQRLSLIE
eukprot:TRINITY_DN3411_c0_g2_i2.p1 TRINITY_DN3411_c0_g2~~TRINITY_DN3411_c0_g2_i2.p1  ORF type:complete len:714 (-),score=214.05 TRINITY_DN3411_c0_g2_i2:702-2843(-)